MEPLELVVINEFCSIEGAREGAEKVLNQLAAFALDLTFSPYTLFNKSSSRKTPCI
jgi:hypothetical protein